MKKWMKVIALGVLLLAVCTVVIGATYEAQARSRVARAFPAPGRLVDIGGGRRIQLDCRGTGAPVVVFESGLDNLGSLSWAAVHDSVARSTRACAYSRAGIMWSDPAGRPMSSANVAEDLHNALAVAAERPPYVMVGHSLGGPYLLTYTGRYAGDVAGLVFVDASHPDQVARMRAATGKDLKQSTSMVSAAAALAWTGLVRVAIPAGVPPTAPAAIKDPSGAYFATSLGPVLEELRGLDATLAAAGSTRQLGDRPLVVLTANEKMKPEALAQAKITAEQGERLKAEWLKLHDEEATWSTRSRHEIVADASHYIQFDRPAVVIAAVREVVEQVRRQAP
jgi:pimeloyl-ACP methyl ester carboxylesterase